MPPTTPTRTKKDDHATPLRSGGNSPIAGSKTGQTQTTTVIATANNKRETNTNNAAPAMTIQGGAGSNKDDGNTVVPHVVRVTFLGVSGLLAKPPHPPPPLSTSTEESACTVAESGGNASIIMTPTQITSSTQATTTMMSSAAAAPNHPSLLFPLPSNLRLVASISRSRTARGIPSELSHHLTKSSTRHHNRGSEKRSSSSSGGGDSGGDGGGVEVNGGSELGTPIIGSTEQPMQQLPERYVAIWDDDGISKRPNSLAFEADLRPSTIIGALEGGRGGVTAPDNAAAGTENVQTNTNTHLASTAYAPKSFFITIGLVSDSGSSSSDNCNPASLQQHQGPTTATTTTYQPTSTSYQPTSTFAIPVAFTDLVINGEETLNGKRKQIDLPLSSINSIINVFGEDNLRPTPNNSNNINFPLIELSTNGIGTKVAGGSNSSNTNSTTVVADEKATLSSQMMSNTTTMSPKTKKKSLIKRILSRRPLHPMSSTAASTSLVSTTPLPSVEVYSGTLPRSIYELDRPPNSNERALFLNRYGIDDGSSSSGAVLRIGLEVFPRGSELERIFRQKKYLRKKYAQAAESSSSRKGIMSSSSSKAKKIGTMVSRRGSGDDDNSTQCTTNSIDNNTLDSPSLMDTLDEESDYYHDNEDGSMTYSESYFTFDDNASRTTSWGESTMGYTGYTGYTDEFSRVTSYGTFNSLDTYNSGEYDDDDDDEEEILSSMKSENFFSTLLCHIDKTCGADKTESVTTGTAVGLGSNFSTDENSITIDNRYMILSCTSSQQQQRKGGSTDDASENTSKQRTNQENAVMFPNDTSNENASEPESCSIEISPDDTTVAKQTTPLAFILQRISDENDMNVVVAGGKRELKEEGHELTLEDHVSSSM